MGGNVRQGVPLITQRARMGHVWRQALGRAAQCHATGKPSP